MFYLRFCVFLFFCAKLTNSECRKSYATMCDSFADLETLPKASTITDLVVGSDYANSSRLESVHLMNTLRFSRYNKLKSLMVLNQIKELKSTYAYLCFYNGKSLRHVLFHGNIMKQIDAYHFPVFEAERFSLTNNKIERITGGALTAQNVIEFDASDNLMEVIEARAVPSTEVTKVITIKNNRLTHLEPNCFPASLKSLNLENNILRYINGNILAPLVQLEELVLTNNKLKTVPKIGHLKNLVNFQIASNEISKITPSTFENLNKLKYIDLSGNKIVDTNVIVNINTPLKNPQLRINLALNRLEDLDLKDLNRQEQIYVVYGNPFDCDKWNEIEKLRGKAEDGCEEKFVSSGKVPYCVKYHAGQYPFVNLYENDIDRFIDAVKQQKKTFKCSLDPDMEDLLNSVPAGCVG